MQQKDADAEARVYDKMEQHGQCADRPTAIQG